MQKVCTFAEIRGEIKKYEKAISMVKLMHNFIIHTVEYKYVCPNRYCTGEYCTPAKILGEIPVCILWQSEICISPQILADLQCSTLPHLWGHTYFYSTVWIIMLIIGFKTKNHVFQWFKISPLVLANVQTFCKQIVFYKHLFWLPCVNYDGLQ